MTTQPPAGRSSDVERILTQLLALSSLGVFPHKFTVRGVEMDVLPTLKMLQVAYRDGQITAREAMNALRPLTMQVLRLVDARIHGIPIDIAVPLGVILDATEDGHVTVGELAPLVPFVYQVITAAIGAGTPHAPAAPPTTTPPVPWPPAATTTTTPAPLGNPGGRMQITALKAGILFIEGDRDDKDAERHGIAGQRYGADHVQQKHERVHLDCTPTPDDRDHNETLVMADGHSPAMQPRWGRVVNGKEILNWNSHDEDDHWELQSYEKKNASDTSGPGLTPVLFLENQFGPGQTKCFAYFILPGEFNGGLTVESDRVYWQAD